MPARAVVVRKSLPTKKGSLAVKPAPSAIKGLKGFRKASAFFSGAVDRGVSQQNPALASRANVLSGLDARLVYIDEKTGSDRYYVLQGLEDPKVTPGKPRRCYAYQRWGKTGTGGVCRIQGPMEEAKVEAHLARVFKAKTGADWGSLQPGTKARPGKYWLSAAWESDPSAAWEYYVDDGVDRKCKGWHPYDDAAISQVEALYAEHRANRTGSNSTARRFVSSGSFVYCVDLEAMSQRNTSTGTERRIRRVRSTSSSGTNASRTTLIAPGHPRDEGLGLARADVAAAHLAHAESAETEPAVWSDAEWSSKIAALRRGSSSGSSLPGLPGRRRISRSVAMPTSTTGMRQLLAKGDVEKMTIPDLRSWLSARGIVASGSKASLVARVKLTTDKLG